MKKGLLTAVLAVVIAVLFFGAQKAQAGHDIGTLSKENPCVYVRFSLEKGENFFGAFYAVSGTAKDVSIVIENLSKGDVSLDAEISRMGEDSSVLKNLSLKKGKKQVSAALGDMKNKEEFFIFIENANCYDLDKMDIGISVYSEGWGAGKHDFTKLVLKKNEVTLKAGKKTTLKYSIDKDLKKSGVTWSSSDKSVVTVSKKGKITAKKEGYAVITCTSKKNKNISAQCTIWVDANFVQSGDITDVTLTEEPFNLDSAYRELTLESNGYSGSVTIEVECDDGVDSFTVQVEKNKTYVLEYRYDFTNVDDNWEDYIWGGINMGTKVLSVSVQGGEGYSAYSKFTGNKFRKGSHEFHEK